MEFWRFQVQNGAFLNSKMTQKGLGNQMEGLRSSRGVRIELVMDLRTEDVVIGGGLFRFVSRRF
jgi:hypothetical protein